MTTKLTKSAINFDMLEKLKIKLLRYSKNLIARIRPAATPAMLKILLINPALMPIRRVRINTAAIEISSQFIN